MSIKTHVKKVTFGFVVTGILMVASLEAFAHKPVPNTDVTIDVVDSYCGMALDDWIKEWKKRDQFVWKVDGKFIPYNFYGAQKKLPQRLFPPEKATVINIAGIDITIVPLGSKAFHRIDQYGKFQIDITCLIDLENIEVLKIIRKYNLVEDSAD